MNVLATADEMRRWTVQRKAAGESVGLVPTMGYLHEAHLSLVDLAKRASGAVVVSVFVNPTQFGPGEDYEAYPRDEERDLRLCRERGVAAVYLPPVSEMYPEGYATYVEVEGLGDQLCGASRPGHFRGVCTVVSKLFNAVQPDVAVFGRKDAQQARILERMTSDLQFGIRIVLGDTLREHDGLAMSSRNVRLSREHRAQAPALYRGLRDALRLFERGERSASEIVRAARERIERDAPGGDVEYVELVDWNTLAPVTSIERTALLALAVRFGPVRLIDNVLLEV
ncbi:MAG: Pantothenate synthetase [Calditrichaeota bacterium]|nr:Pantothenate synthetase [Calditrichota bacterium]